MNLQQVRTFLLLGAVSLIGATQLAAQGTAEKSIVTAAAAAKFGPIPNAPECFTVAVERGDPTKRAIGYPGKICPRMCGSVPLAFTQRNRNGG
jgi:hypothetical protein